MIVNNQTVADTTFTIEEFIASKDSDEITNDKFTIAKYMSGIELPITNLLYDYEEELNSMAVKVKLTDLEMIKYKYKPSLFAYDVYGSVETEFLILMMNNIIDPKDFDFNPIRVVPKSKLVALLGRISSINETYLYNVNSRKREDIKNSVGNVVWSE
jgi:hypothetical protein